MCYAVLRWFQLPGTLQSVILPSRYHNLMCRQVRAFEFISETKTQTYWCTLKTCFMLIVISSTITRSIKLFPYLCCPLITRLSTRLHFVHTRDLLQRRGLEQSTFINIPQTHYCISCNLSIHPPLDYSLCTHHGHYSSRSFSIHSTRHLMRRRIHPC